MKLKIRFGRWTLDVGRWTFSKQPAPIVHYVRYEPTTKENLEEKFDRGDDVLDYFDETADQGFQILDRMEGDRAYTACGANAPSSQLTSRPRDVTCRACIDGMEAAGSGILTYQLGHDKALRASWIKCLGCGLTSYLPQDIFHLYCGHCHIFHDDIWPPARKWWIENTPKVVDAKGRRILTR